MLVHKKEGKEQDTLASAFILRCSPKQAVTKLDLAAHKLRELLRDSDSRSLYSYFVSATQRDGMGFISPNSQRRRLGR